jgi:hypothetical protein
MVVNVYKEVFDSVIDTSDPFAIEFTGLHAATSEVKITFTVFGDFSNRNEWIDLSADSYQFGRWLDHTNKNDSIRGPGSEDKGNEYESNITGWVKLSANDFNSLIIGDDAISFLFDYNRALGNATGLRSYVNNLDIGDYAKVELNYTAAPAPISAPSLVAVPLPPSVMFYLTGLIGLFSLRCRKFFHA